jgi:peptide deformylase
MVFINPVIIRKNGAIVSREGCLSFPGVYTDVKRYEAIIVRYMDLKGKTKTIEVPPDTLLCRAIQHELDHLDGVLFVDHVIDRFGADQLLAENQLPPIQADYLLNEPELDDALTSLSA